ncbi:MAG: peptidylprolyl isomerase [Deltaproteobacteria bacterium]|nr:peptidylprolyl isomerase [Deltaproteobacteria bacterium]MBW2071801.1 peptidylprolyl isomerase [Deltaproteobacteria bacterium]
MDIQPQNTYVSLKYTVQLENGEIVKGDPREGLAHMEFVTGYNQILPALEQKLKNLSEGDEVEFTLSPEEAFGEHNPSLIQEKTFDEFPQGRDLVEGSWVRAINPDHLVSFSYRVLEKRQDRVVLDYNHPLVGKALRYKVRVEKVRPATPDELEILKPCEYGRDHTEQ